MNGMISLQISNKALKRANKMLRRIPKQSQQVVARAVNRTMDGIRTDAVRETHKKYFVSAKDVRASLSFRKATAGNLMGAMVSKGRRYSLADYKLTPNSPRPGKKLLLKAAVKRAGGLKPLAKEGKPIGFLVKRAGGKYFPFYRIGYDSENRQHKGIRSYISPSMPQIVNNEETVQVMEQCATERFEKRLYHEFFRAIGVIV